MKRSKRVGKTRHHVLPRSKEGSDHGSNIVWVSQKEHDAYHLLFVNKTPTEILALLRDKWGFGRHFAGKGGFLSWIKGELFKQEVRNERRINSNSFQMRKVRRSD